MEDDLWIFGYGSLVWRPDFPFRERRPAYIEGWMRRFWQGSTDHRGVPGAPGRVVTLLPAAGTVCWGMAYNIGGEESDATLAHLDYREKGGYQVERTVLNFDADEAVLDGLIYVATPENPNYLGPADPVDIARQVRAAHGPSGPNDEYVVRLADALRQIGVDDPHVFELEALILGA
jgi:cation transport regulator ChaC